MHVDARAWDDIWKKQFSGVPSRGLEGKQKIHTKKVDWKNDSVKSCWVIKVHYGLTKNGE